MRGCTRPSAKKRLPVNQPVGKVACRDGSQEASLYTHYAMLYYCRPLKYPNACPGVGKVFARNCHSLPRHTHTRTHTLSLSLFFLSFISPVSAVLVRDGYGISVVGTPTEEAHHPSPFVHPPCWLCTAKPPVRPPDRRNPEEARTRFPERTSKTSVWPWNTQPENHFATTNRSPTRFSLGSHIRRERDAGVPRLLTLFSFVVLLCASHTHALSRSLFLALF